jgi:two-component system, OmpR family, alkaline phosphatase synthesis response regulator PhoP
LVLSARNAVRDKVVGFESGGDDYLTKPFDVLELLARVKALLRRSQVVVEQKPAELAIGAYTLRLDTGQAKTTEGDVILSDKELLLMRTFMTYENRVLSRAELLEEVWGMDRFPSDRTIDNFLVRLRKLFEENPEEPVHFLTIRGRGYLFRRSA